MAFQFKKFSIDDRLCAMKVGTDGTLLGAWCEPPINALRVLDIGTGSGLLALMLAQRFPRIHIQAIEIDEHATIAATANVNASPWSHRIQVQNISLQDYFEFNQRSLQKFDAIVCNPPYFANDMKAEAANRRLARHQDSLSIEELFRFSCQLLSSHGTVSLVMPANQTQQVVNEAASYQLYLRRQVDVIPLPGQLPKRCLLEFGFHATTIDRQSLLLEERRHQRSPGYRELTKDFYLKS